MKGTLDRKRVPNNILDREDELRGRIEVLERLIGAIGRGAGGIITTQTTIGEAAGFALAQPGLLGAWMCGYEKELDRIVDYSGVGAHLTMLNEPQIEVAGVVPIVSLDSGSSQYLFHNATDQLTIHGFEDEIPATMRGLSFVTWVRFDNTAASSEAVAGRWGNVDDPEFRCWRLYRNSSGNLVFELYGGTTLTGSTVLLPDVWYCVSAVWLIGTSITIYVNGVEDGVNITSIPSFLDPAASASFTIGQMDGGNYITGDIFNPFFCVATISAESQAYYFLTTSSLFAVGATI